MAAAPAARRVAGKAFGARHIRQALSLTDVAVPVAVDAEASRYRIVSQGGGAYRSVGVFGGAPRLVAVRPLRDYPLVVDVSIDEAQALAPGGGGRSSSPSARC